MSELNGNEKHADLPKPLPANAGRPGTIRNGDLMLYGADTLVVFYLTFRVVGTRTPALVGWDDPSEPGDRCSGRAVFESDFPRTSFLNDAASVGPSNEATWANGSSRSTRRSVMTRDTKTNRQAGCSRRSVLRTALATLTFSFVRASAATPGGEMDIKRNGTQPSGKGPADWFTGTVRIDPLFDAPIPPAWPRERDVRPGPRTAWHTHPLGQTLIVTAGAGARSGGAARSRRFGRATCLVPPGEKHWHGASPTTAMTHIAIQEKLDGKEVEWMEHVTAEQDEGRSGGS